MVKCRTITLLGSINVFNARPLIRKNEHSQSWASVRGVSLCGTNYPQSHLLNKALAVTAHVSRLCIQVVLLRGRGGVQTDQLQLQKFPHANIFCKFAEQAVTETHDSAEPLFENIWIFKQINAPYSPCRLDNVSELMSARVTDGQGAPHLTVSWPFDPTIKSVAVPEWSMTQCRHVTAASLHQLKNIYEQNKTYPSLSTLIRH